MPVPLSDLSGKFYRAIAVNQMDRVLAPPTAQSAGRYHRHGQSALYMSPSLEWVRTAVSGYMREDRKPRYVFTLEVTGARVFDQRSQSACREIGIDPETAGRPWRQALKDGREPESWQVADRVRALDADGLVDVSRNIPDGWHVVLFKWNESGGPKVRVSGGPETIHPTLED